MPMTVYFFDLMNGDGPLPDEEGRDLPDDAAATREAEEEILALAAGEIAEGRPLLLGSYITIRRGDGGEPRRISFGEVIEVRR